MVMARYYLHIWKGEVLECEDKEGAEVASLEDAYLEAFASAQELWNDLIRRHRDPRQFAFVITDADGVALTELPFGEILESCHPILPRLPMNASRLIKATQEAVREAAENSRQARRLSAELRKGLDSVHQAISALASPPI
jgi:hypothetical protein